MKRLNGWILPADRTTEMMLISMICIGSFFYKVVFLNPLTLLAALLYLTTVITVLVKIARYCTQGHHVLVKLIIRGIVYVFIPFCIFEATLVLHTWSVHIQVMRNSGWYPLTEIVWCFFTVIGCVISEALLLAVRAEEGPDIEEDADAGSLPNSGKSVVKRLIGMLLAVVVGWIGLLFIISRFTGSPEDIEHELVLVHNENGEVTEFTKYGTTDSDLEQLRDMPELETLNLWGSENITDAGLAHLKGLAKLQHFDLREAKITDAGLVHLKGMTNLKALGLTDCLKITDAGLVHLKGLTNLEGLGLRGCEKIADAGLVHLKGLTNLKALNLRGCEKITDAGLIHLKGLTELQTLGLMETQITDAGLVHLKGMTNLEGLGLMQTWITDAGLVHLEHLTNLQNLTLIGCPSITDSGVAELQKALPNCEISR